MVIGFGFGKKEIFGEISFKGVVGIEVWLYWVEK